MERLIISTLKRNYNLDLLKVIATLCIILAHVDPTKFIFQLRNFDVPLMIMISVWLSIKTINNKQFKYSEYIKKRIKRLLIPTWIFLTIYFLIYYIIGNIPSVKTILLSYLLMGGIGYVWIIRIYIYIAISTPIVNKIYNKTKKWEYIGVISVIYLIHMLIIKITSNIDGIPEVLITATIIDFVGYSLIIFVAIFVYKLKNKDVSKVAIVFGIIYILLGIKYDFIETQQFKYPITLYYLSYAIFVGLILYSFLNYINMIKELKVSKYVMFISNNSMWIYLWHILYLGMINRLFNNISYGYILRFIILTILAILTTYIQNRSIKIFLRKSK